MDKLLAMKDNNMEFYAKVEITTTIWTFLDELASLLYGQNWMIDDHYRGEIKNNNYFSFNCNGIYLIIIMTDILAHIVIIGLPDNNVLKELVFKHYSF
ncbi:hypothetical protein HYX12_01065 [Candidatus Woesearchaeota archaeon]|nr:hypothetical protein [Candidatus Woesearchaeota archaeon]